VAGCKLLVPLVGSWLLGQRRLVLRLAHWGEQAVYEAPWSNNLKSFTGS
jgi:hypothetical protein